MTTMTTTVMTMTMVMTTTMMTTMTMTMMVGNAIANPVSVNPPQGQIPPPRSDRFLIQMSRPIIGPMGLSIG